MQAADWSGSLGAALNSRTHHVVRVTVSLFEETTTTAYLLNKLKLLG